MKLTTSADITPDSRDANQSNVFKRRHEETAPVVIVTNPPGLMVLRAEATDPLPPKHPTLETPSKSGGVSREFAAFKWKKTFKVGTPMLNENR